MFSLEINSFVNGSSPPFDKTERHEDDGRPINFINLHMGISFDIYGNFYYFGCIFFVFNIYIDMIPLFLLLHIFFILTINFQDGCNLKFYKNICPCLCVLHDQCILCITLREALFV